MDKSKNMKHSFLFPPIPDSIEKPEWTGNGFKVGETKYPLLSYEIQPSGWTDELTNFHERAAGDSHFIDIASRRHAISQIQKYCKLPSPIILDIGCSSGFLLKDLRDSFQSALIMGADIVTMPLLNLARSQPDIPLLHFDLTRCPLPDQSVDVVVLLNVLEHIERDSLAIEHVYRILKPGGLAIIEVPAGPEMYDIYDELLMHFRRYKLSDLKNLFLRAGFKIYKKSHLGFFLYPGFYLVKKSRKGKRQDIRAEEIPGMVSKDINETGQNPVFSWLMQLELILGKAVQFPFGIRCLLTCYKPE